MSLIHNNRVLWTLQVLLALIFAFAGSVKLMMPADQLTASGPAWVTAGLLRFVAVMELLGAAGLIVPWLLRIRPELTPLAAVGLVVIMIGAVAISALTMGAATAILPLVVGLLAAIVAVGRRPATTRASLDARTA